MQLLYKNLILASKAATYIAGIAPYSHTTAAKLCFLTQRPNLWMKRDDLCGFEGGGNKTRKLDFLVGDALKQYADMLVTVGAIQSNHTHQTAAVAVNAGLNVLCCTVRLDNGRQLRLSVSR
jgi:1-aminocyclopropane-1-carboxylate deaminase/D-cysteine desulfhydrase-like pyridoxal-dependent ACC family enzyme